MHCRNRKLRIEQLESRDLLAVTLTSIDASARDNTNGANLRFGGPVAGDVVAMDMGDFRVEFYDNYGGAPLALINQYNGGNVIISDPFPGAAVQTVYSQGSSPTQSTPNGISPHRIAKLGDTTSPHSFYARETDWVVGSNYATYETTGYAPVFWDQRLFNNGIPAIDAVPPSSEDEWLTAYSDPAVIAVAGLTPNYFTSCRSATAFDGCVPIVYQGGADGGVFMLGSEQAAVRGLQPWTERLFETADGRVAIKTRVRLADAPSNDAVASILFQRDVPNNASESDVFTSPGYFLNLNQFGDLSIYKVTTQGEIPINPVWSQISSIAATNAASAIGALIELRTIRNGTSDTFEVWVENQKIGEWTDPNPVRGQHVGLFAQSTTGRVEFYDRQVFDLNTEIVSRYTGFDDGRLRSDIVVRTTNESTVPTNMYHNSMPGAFLDWCPDGGTTPCVFPSSSALGRVFDGNGSELESIGNGSDLMFLANQWGGVADNGEFGVAGTSFFPNGATDEVFVGNLNNGIAVTDNAVGEGYLMYSEQVVHSRFANVHSSNSDHLIAVRFDGFQWQYNTDQAWVDFTPALSDVLLANVDFTGDTVVRLAGEFGNVHGINAGFESGIFVAHQGVKATDPYAYWLGDQAGQYGLFTIPRISKVNGELVDTRVQIDNNANNFPNGEYPVRALQLGTFSNYGLDPMPVTSTQLVADWWVTQPNLSELLPSEVTISTVPSLNENNADMIFRAELDHPSTELITMRFETSDLTATAGSDYTATTCNFTFQPGQTLKTCGVPILEDGIVEMNEQFEFVLAESTNVIVANDRAVGTIRNDDTTEFYITDRIQPEGDDGTTSFSFKVRLTKPSDVAQQVDFTTRNGTAQAGADYDFASGTLFFPPLTFRQDVVIQVRGDIQIESDETFLVDIFNGTAPISSTQSTGVGLIKNNDFPPEAADFDTDGDVDGADFLAWQRGFGTSSGASPSDGDANGDGAVDDADLSVWTGSYGHPQTLQTVASSEQLTAAVDLIDAALAMEWLDTTSEEPNVYVEESISVEAVMAVSNKYNQLLPSSSDVSEILTPKIADARESPSEPWLDDEMLESVFG